MNLKTLKGKRIGVLYGGWSSEREVSLESGRAVACALKQAGYKVTAIDVKKDRIGRIKSSGIDIAFIALHGPFGEDGTIQAILEMMNIPYTGSNVLASALAMDKIYSKKIFEWHGLPTPEWLAADRSSPVSIPGNIGFPLVVKPVNQGSTIGISVVRNKGGLKKALSGAFRYGDKALIEKYIPGRELTVSILGDMVLPVIEITPESGSFYDYRAKYAPGGSRHTVPAELPSRVTRLLQELSKKAFDALGCRAVGRVDFRLDPGNRPYILEVNTIPGMTKTSLLPEAARAAHIDFTEMTLRMIRSSIYG